MPAGKVQGAGQPWREPDPEGRPAAAFRWCCSNQGNCRCVYVLQCAGPPASPRGVLTLRPLYPAKIECQRRGRGPHPSRPLDSGAQKSRDIAALELPVSPLRAVLVCGRGSPSTYTFSLSQLHLLLGAPTLGPSHLFRAPTAPAQRPSRAIEVGCAAAGATAACTLVLRPALPACLLARPTPNPRGSHLYPSCSGAGKNAAPKQCTRGGGRGGRRGRCRRHGGRAAGMVAHDDHEARAGSA